MMKMRLCMWMKRTNSFTRRLNLVLPLALAPCLAFSLAVPAGVLLAAPAAAHAQKNVPKERIAEGKVVNRDGQPIGGAVVYLKNSRSSGVKTYIADEDGHFRFGALAQNMDYELWAESNGVRSKSREISSFDNENKFYFTLKINVSKPASPDGSSITHSNLIQQP